MNTNYQLIEDIKGLLKEGLTQRQVAERLRTTQGNISITCKKYGLGWQAQRRNQDGENNSQFKNGLGRSTIERTTRSVLLLVGRDLTKCERCGYVDATKQELPRHHKDRNRSNNILSNLEILCWGCHNKEHMSERSRDEFGRFVNG